MDYLAAIRKHWETLMRHAACIMGTFFNKNRLKTLDKYIRLIYYNNIDKQHTPLAGRRMKKWKILKTLQPKN